MLQIVVRKTLATVLVESGFPPSRNAEFRSIMFNLYVEGLPSFRVSRTSGEGLAKEPLELDLASNVFLNRSTFLGIVPIMPND